MNADRLTTYLDELVEKDGIPCCAVEVFHRHRCIYKHYAGFGDADKRVVLNEEHLFYGYSVTKIYTATLIMQLIEEKKMDLNDEVSHFIPAFGEILIREGKTYRKPNVAMTIRHLLTMTSGLSYNWNAPALKQLWREHPDANAREAADAIAKDYLRFEPGSMFLYGFSMDILGVIAEIVEGEPLSSLLKKRIFDPIGLRHSFMGNPDSLSGRIVAQYQYREMTDKIQLCPPEKQSLFFPCTCFESGGGGLITNASDMAAFAAVLACGGTTESGVRIISEESIREMRENRLSGQALDMLRRWQGNDYGYGYGVRTRMREADGIPAGEFSWSGVGGTHLSVDMKNELSFSYTQQILDHAPALERIHPAIQGLIFGTD